MRKPKKMPRGVYFRGLSICVKFALADGTIERRTIGPASQFSPEDCERKRLNWKQQVAEGTYTGVTPAPMPSPVKIFTIGDLWNVYLTSYKNNEGRDAGRLEIAWNHLKAMFESVAVRDVTTALVAEYIAHRKAAGMSNGTINRETTMLKAMLNLGAKQTPPMVDRLPSFPKRLKESAPRKGFVQDAEYAVLKANAKHLWLRGLLALGYRFGFRKGEMLSLRVSQVDLLSKEIRLGHDTKTGEPRLVSMTTEVYQLMLECLRGKKANDYVLTRDGSSEPIVDFRDDWNALCSAAKLPTLHVHDLRRSAVRNMVRKGIPERICMAISGHKTRAVFDRYNIIDTADIIAASAKLEPVKTDTEQTQPVYGRN
jgi:integrase